MDINYLGHSSFRIKGRSAAVVTDPYSTESVGLKYPSVKADIVTISHHHDDHNQASNVKEVSRVIDGPGEYEVMDISIIGLPTFHDNKKGELRGQNTIYVIEVDKVRVAHLGDLGHKLTEKMLEQMGEIDILMIPVGGHYTIGSEVAAEIVKSIEPKVVIPMHYQSKGLKKEMFENLAHYDEFVSKLDYPVEKMDKLSVKKDDIGENNRVVVLSS